MPIRDRVSATNPIRPGSYLPRGDIPTRLRNLDLQPTPALITLCRAVFWCIAIRPLAAPWFHNPRVSSLLSDRNPFLGQIMARVRSRWVCGCQNYGQQIPRTSLASYIGVVFAIARPHRSTTFLTMRGGNSNGFGYPD